jgi:outer membrane protein OmpA-like peptidoglycan-associated protein/LysM repeat protein
MDSTGWRYDEQSNDEKFKRLNSEYNDGAGCINVEHDKYYVTICKEFNKDRTDVNCAIYVSDFKEGVWAKPEKLNENINPDDTWNAQPSLTPSGDTMYFVSKRDGGFGMHDIWVSTKPSEGEDWSAAVNMGDNINTPDIDFSPSYYREEGVLFFASDGHEGFGGQDIFMARGEGFEDVRNIGLPFNSNRDDFYFVLGQEKGYLSSNREGGSGNDDIYYFNIKSRETIIAELLSDSIDDGLITIKGRILKENGDPAPGVGILLVNKTTGEVLKRTETDEDGVFIFANLDPSIEYKILLEDDDPSLTTLVDYKLDNVTIERSETPAVVEVDMTDETDGDISTDTETDGQDNVGRDVILTPGKAIFENVYFDSDKSKLKSTSKKVLKEIADYALSHEGVRIDIQGFTDSKGSYDYNVALGRRRAKTAYDYLVKKGVPRSALISSSLGESDPVASNDNEIGRQLNRRVQFTITGGTSYDSKTMAFVLEPRTTLDDVAELFSMSKDEIAELNGEINTSAYNVVRVRRLDDNAVISSLSLAKADVPATNSSVPTVGNATNTTKTGTYVTFDDHPNNIGVKYMKYNGSGYYVVLPKNTLFSIARVTGSTVESIKELNNLSNNNIFPGQRLKISADAAPMTSEENLVDSYNTLADAGVTVQDQHGEVIMIGDSKRYVVKAGDTFWTICQQFGLSLEELRDLNGKSDYVVRPGMPLKVSLEDK